MPARAASKSKGVFATSTPGRWLRQLLEALSQWSCIAQSIVVSTLGLLQSRQSWYNIVILPHLQQVLDQWHLAPSA